VARLVHSGKTYSEELATDPAVRFYLDNNDLLREFSSRPRYSENDIKTSYPAHWFNQLLDHFSFNPTTWKQRYFINNSYYKQNRSPQFIFLGGEAPAPFFNFQEAQIIKWAQQFNALYLVIEHRYYGESLPFKKFSTANMSYLTSQQALADAANFITWYNTTLENPGPWIVFGCSYSGALSAWFRAKYPNIVFASVAPSGPVNAFSNFTGYFGQFQTSAGTIPGCVSAVQQGVAQISDLWNTNLAKLQQMFNSCEPLTLKNQWYFNFRLMGTVGSSDQMDNPPSWPLNATCAAMVAGNASNYGYASAWAGLMDSSKCNNFDPSVTGKLASLEIPNSNRAWMWQSCAEFGWFKPSYPGTSIFWSDITLENVMSICEASFQIKNMQPNTAQTNAYYGGPDLLATNVMFTNGLLDPWHLVSILSDVPAPSQVQAVTYDAGHCATVDQSYSTDPPSVVSARQVVVNFLNTSIAQWMKLNP